jgi:CRP-like cAMP-binding protein
LRRNSKNFIERIITYLEDKSSFGELALINDSPRTATIKVVQNTHFAAIEKEDY